MQYYYYFYTAMTTVALIVHVIINWRQLFNWRNLKARAGALEYRLFLVSLLVLFISDSTWGVLAEMRLPRPLHLDTILYFLMMALSLFSWTHFVVAYLAMGGWQRRILRWASGGLLAFFVALLVANEFTGCFFRVTAEGAYTTGQMRDVAHEVVLAFNALGSALTLYMLFRTQGVLRRHNKMVFIFGVTMMLAIALQFSNVFVPFFSIGCHLGCCLLHVFVVEDERTEMRRREMLTQIYQAQLDAERKANQAKSLFFSTVSHDIRTPLNAIIGFSDLLEQGVPDAELCKHYISTIRSSGKVLARLVDDILDLSKMECGKLEIIEEPTDVPSLVREVIDACEVARARKSLALKAEIDDMPLVSLDPQRIRQLIFNLLSNAYKYTAHGTIIVRVRWLAGTLIMAISDTGKGISKENLSRILQPFVQVADKNSRDGTGLGLPICQKLASLMNGKLEIVSEVGVGSTFTVTLHGVKTVDAPADKGDAARKEAEKARARLSASRVLVVDDSSVNRTVLKALLAKCGISDVSMAENGRAALELLNKDSRFDLVFSDLWMPEMDGWGLIGAIRADDRLSSLPVYLVTADVEVRDQAEANGFTGILLKPLSLKTLQTLLA